MTTTRTSTTFRARGHADRPADALAEALVEAARRKIRNPRIVVGGDSKVIIPDGQIPWELTGKVGR